MIAGNHVVVQLVGAHISQRGVPLVVHQAGFLLQRRVGPADVQAALGHLKIGGDDDVHSVGIHVDAARRLHNFLDGFHAAPHARKAAHREGMQAHVQNVLNAAGEKHRQAASFENVVALVRCRAALGNVVVTGNRNHAAVFRGAGHVGVFEHIRATVNARAFAVPNAKHAVEFFRLRINVELLRAPQRGGRQLFIHARLEHDVLRRQMFFGRPQRLVVATERRAAVATDEAGGVQPHGRIALALQHRQAHQGLRATHESAPAGQAVFVVEGDEFQRFADGFGQGCVHQ